MRRYVTESVISDVSGGRTSKSKVQGAAEKSDGFQNEITQ